MQFKESEILELKRSTSELKEIIISIAAIPNKHQRGELYFGIRNDSAVVGQMVNEKTIRDISETQADYTVACLSNKLKPGWFPKEETN